MKEKKNLLTKSQNLLTNSKKVFKTINIDDHLLFPKMKTINNISRNYDNNLESVRLSNKTDKVKYFLSEYNSKNLKYQIINRKMRKYKSNINIKNKKTKKGYKDEEYKDYSAMIKHLEKWDKEHCKTNKNKGDTSLLYNNLIMYYKNNNLVNEEKNLNLIDNMLKTKNGFQQFLYNGYLNQNNLLKDLIMRNPTIKKNKINKEDEKINENKNNNNNNKDDVFIKLLNIKKEEKKNRDFYPNKILKERLKYEKELHQKLFFINNLLFNKKFLKEEKKKLLDKIYEEKNKMIIDYNDKYSKDMKQYWLRYDEYDYKFKRKAQIINPDINNKSLSPRRKSVAFSGLSSHIKNMEYIKNNKITSLNVEMLRKQKNLKNEYVGKIQNYNSEKNKLEKEIKIINNEIIYYKQVNDELLREYKFYYMDILKKGTDIRKDGLLWVVKNLIELQINLEYQHFPKYLTHEQIDYLKNLAYISLEENELKIIISVLKKRQSNEIINDNIQRMKIVDTLMTDTQGSSKTLNNYLENDDLTKKFIKIYKNNQQALKLTLDKNEEDIKIKNILNQIKKGLYSIGDNINTNQNNKNFINENKNNILNAFMGKAKDKDLFSLILSIRNRLIDLDIIKKHIIEKEKENYLESLKFIGNNYFIEKMPFKELIKKSLFGFTQFDLELK